MNENINLVEILKDAPKGTKLYSPICGECELIKADSSDPYPIICMAEGRNTIKFDERGKSMWGNGECVIFPSKENRDWATFKAPWKHQVFEPGQKVLVPYYDGDKHRWKLDIYSHWEEGSKLHLIITEAYLEDKNILPFEGNENKLGKPVE